MTREEIVEAARSWLGVAWKHQGRTRLKGVDCIGLVVKVGEQFNVPHIDRTDYGREPNNLTLLNHLRKFLIPASRTLIKPGDIGAFRQSRFPCHVGIFSEVGGILHVIHANAGNRKVTEDQFDATSAIYDLTETLSFPGVTD